ncbi:hypothetical protein ACQP3L_36815, partial [Escherichia coli]
QKSLVLFFCKCKEGKSPTRQNKTNVEEKSIKQFALQGTSRGNFHFDLPYLHPGFVPDSSILKMSLSTELFDYNLFCWLRAQAFN